LRASIVPCRLQLSATPPGDGSPRTCRPTSVPGSGEGQSRRQPRSEEGTDAADLHHFSHRLDIEELALSDEEILAAIETSLAAQGRGQTVIEPRVHLAPGQSNGHFNVLRGAINAPVDRAGIKVVGDFVDNYKLGFPSELGVVLLLDPRTGAPQAILDGAGITDMRTGAMTAVGAKYLARKNSKILGHIGARGSAYWNVRLLDHLFDFDEIRVHSKRPESRNGFAKRLQQDLGKSVTADRRLALLRRRPPTSSSRRRD